MRSGYERFKFSPDPRTSPPLLLLSVSDLTRNKKACPVCVCVSRRASGVFEPFLRAFTNVGNHETLTTAGSTAGTRFHTQIDDNSHSFRPTNWYFKEIACSVITPTPTSPSNFPTASLGVPPIGWVACSVTNLSLCSVLGYKPLSLSFRRPPQRIPILSPWRPTPLLNT